MYLISIELETVKNIDFDQVISNFEEEDLKNRVGINDMNAIISDELSVFQKTLKHFYGSYLGSLSFKR